MAKTGTLMLKPISAQLTRDTEIFGKMDPFVTQLNLILNIKVCDKNWNAGTKNFCPS